MIKHSIQLSLFAALLGLYSCQSSSFKTTEHGLEYNIVHDAKEGRNPQEGDYVTLHLEIHYTDDKTDTLIFSSREMNNHEPLEFPIMPSLFKGDWTDGIKLLTPGDSALFRVSVDSMRQSGQGILPEFMAEGERITYRIALVDVKTPQEMEEEQAEFARVQMEKEEALLQAYFEQKGIKPEKTASGLYYLIDRPGSGPQIQAGQQVTVNYTGTNMDGTPFDSNVDPQFSHVEPFRFTAGRDMIEGWNEGILLLKKGAKARFFIPSPLGYGPNSPSPAIEANAPLIFELEVLDVAD